MWACSQAMNPLLTTTHSLSGPSEEGPWRKEKSGPQPSTGLLILAHQPARPHSSTWHHARSLPSCPESLHATPSSGNVLSSLPQGQPLLHLQSSSGFSDSAVFPYICPALPIRSHPLLLPLCGVWTPPALHPVRHLWGPLLMSLSRVFP